MPTASAVRRIAETLCDLLTPSASTVRSGWRRASARRSLANRSGVIGAAILAGRARRYRLSAWCDRDRHRDERGARAATRSPSASRTPCARRASRLGALPRVHDAYERVADDLRERRSGRAPRSRDVHGATSRPTATRASCTRPKAPTTCPRTCAACSRKPSSRSRSRTAGSRSARGRASIFWEHRLSGAPAARARDGAGLSARVRRARPRRPVKSAASSA